MTRTGQKYPFRQMLAHGRVPHARAMSETLTPADVSHYYQRLEDLSTLPFWRLPEMTEPSGPERGHVWSWTDVYPELERSREILDGQAETSQRRALIFRNPGLAMGATTTIAAAYQMLLPGETAPVHAHSMSALRFGLAGHGAQMIVDGDLVPMEPGDLILTPGWSWHGHVHPGHVHSGSDEPVVWLDGLDVPFVASLRANFFRDGPPAGDPVSRHSPVRRYPWQEAYPALQRLMARAPRSFASLEYRHPVTGGPALATLGCLLEGVAAGAATSPARETASSVMVAVQGAGTLACGGQAFDLRRGDVAAVPAWTWHQLSAGREDLIVFRVTDRPIHDAFGLYRVQTADAGT